jgi:hypothetical protein
MGNGVIHESMSKAIGSEIVSKRAKAYDLGLTGLPLAQRPGITLPTPENLDRVAQDAADKRFIEAKAHNVSPDALGRAWGVSRDFVLFVQRLEATVIERGREIAWLRTQIFNPPHTHNIERRG